FDLTIVRSENPNENFRPCLPTTNNCMITGKKETGSIILSKTTVSLCIELYIPPRTNHFQLLFRFCDGTTNQIKYYPHSEVVTDCFSDETIFEQAQEIIQGRTNVSCDHYVQNKRTIDDNFQNCQQIKVQKMDKASTRPTVMNSRSQQKKQAYANKNH
ncbi:unnamed protein product, partial [Didymodactylos carnosus]